MAQMAATAMYVTSLAGGLSDGVVLAGGGVLGVVGVVVPAGSTSFVESF